MVLFSNNYDRSIEHERKKREKKTQRSLIQFTDFVLDFSNLDEYGPFSLLPSTSKQGRFRPTGLTGVGGYLDVGDG